jgi:hypothetical protein
MLRTGSSKSLGHRFTVVRDLAHLEVDLILAPNYFVWRDACRFEQLAQQRRAFLYYCWLREAGLPAIPDVGFSRFEPAGRRWAEWINGQPDLRAVSIFCGGKRIHAERRAHVETVEDIAPPPPGRAPGGGVRARRCAFAAPVGRLPSRRARPPAGDGNGQAYARWRCSATMDSYSTAEASSRVPCVAGRGWRRRWD